MHNNFSITAPQFFFSCNQPCFLAGLVMGRRWWGGPGLSRAGHVVGLGPARPTKFLFAGPRPRPGPARPIKFAYHGPRPGQAHQFFRGWTVARPSIFSEDGQRPAPRPIEFQIISARRSPAHRFCPICRPGPARPMTFAARHMRRGIYMGRPVDLKGRSMDRLKPCVTPYSKVHADVLF